MAGVTLTPRRQMAKRLSGRLRNGKLRLMRVLKRFGRNRDGAYAIEFGMISMPFFALMFAIFDTSMIFFKAEYLQTAVTDAGRLIFTGQAQSSAMTQAQFKNQVCARLPVVIPCSDIYVDVRTFTAFNAANRFNPIDGGGNFNAGGLQFDPGTRNSIVVVSGYVQHGMLFSLIASKYKNLANGKILLTASAAFRNEPFNAGP